jgi:hypothetical protein
MRWKEEECGGDVWMAKAEPEDAEWNECASRAVLRYRVVYAIGGRDIFSVKKSKNLFGKCNSLAKEQCDAIASLQTKKWKCKGHPGLINSVLSP